MTALDGYPKSITLKEGATITVRLMTRDDEHDVSRFFAGLPEEFRRYLGSEVTDRRVIARWMRELDYGKKLPLATGAYGSVSDVRVLTIWPVAIADAGASTATICAGGTYVLTGATASAGSTVTGTTSGGRTFDDIHSLNPVYTPSPGDVSAGSVTLTIEAGFANGGCATAKDYILLAISPAPLVNATKRPSPLTEGSVPFSPARVVWLA